MLFGWLGLAEEPDKGPALAQEEPDPAPTGAPSSSPSADPVGDDRKERAADAALAEAHAAVDAGDDVAARLHAERSVALHATLEAESLLKFLEEYGPGSSAALAVEHALIAAEPCEVLRLPAGQTPPSDMIKRAYKERCLELHPDRNAARGAEDAFKRLQAAYDALLNGGQWERVAVVKPREHSSSHSRRGKRPPGSTSGARWGHGAAAHRGQKPANWNHLDPQKPSARKGPSSNLPRKAAVPSRATSAAKRGGGGGGGGGRGSAGGGGSGAKIWAAMPPGETPHARPPPMGPMEA